MKAYDSDKSVSIVTINEVALTLYVCVCVFMFWVCTSLTCVSVCAC